MRENDDRAAQQQTNSDVSDSGLGDDLRDFLKSPVPAERGKRNLLSTFRPVPGTGSIYESDPLLSAAVDPGFPGTKAFSAHRPDRREAGGAVQSAAAGADAAPAPAARANNLKGWRAAIQQTGRDAGAERPAQPAAASPTGGGIRRRPGRPPGSGKKKEESTAAGLPKDIQKLVPKDAQVPAPSPRLVPTESERSDARRLFREIGETFNNNRKLSKTKAYAAFRHDLMANLDTLIMGGAIDLKEATTIITNLEQYTKETEAESTETPATILGRWLRMDAAEVAGLEVAEKTIDANDQLEVEESVESEEIVDEET